MGKTLCIYLTHCKILSLIVLEVTATTPTKNSYSPANMPRYESFLVKSPPKFRLCLEIVPVLVSISNINSFSLRKSACSRPASLLKQNHFTFRFRILFCSCVFLHFQYNVLRVDLFKVLFAGTQNKYFIWLQFEAQVYFMEILFELKR